MFERFTDAARNVMGRSMALAEELRSPFVRRHHMLYALLGDAEERPDAIPAQMFADANVDVAAFRAAVLASLQASEEPVADEGRTPYSSGAKKAMELALREALSLGHNYIGADHILLAILRSADGPLATTLGTTELAYGNAREYLRTHVPVTGGSGRGGRGGRRDFRQAMRGRRTPGVEAAMERAMHRAGRERALNTGDLLVALAEGRSTHFARLLEGVTLRNDLAAAADRLVSDNTPDGEPEQVRVDPRSGAVTVTDPELIEKLKATSPEKIAEALRRLLDEE